VNAPGVYIKSEGSDIELAIVSMDAAGGLPLSLIIQIF
jgi:hypothetical protein